MPTCPFLLRLVLCLTLASCCLVSVALQRRAATIPSGPKFVLYSASAVGEDVLPPLDQVEGFNVVYVSFTPYISSMILTLALARNLAFLQCDGAHDQALNWANLAAPKRKQLKADYNDAGIALLVTAFGADDLPTTDGRDPAAIADTMARFVLDNDLDGIDVDYEELQLVLAKPGAGETWVSKFTQTLRTHLPKGQFILSHARTS